jgi:atypical protein kinase C zeta type
MFQSLVLRWMTESSMLLLGSSPWGLRTAIFGHQNLLLNIEGRLKLTDCDETAAVGTVFEIGIAPYARVLGDGGGEQRGSFGYIGPGTE